MSSSLKYASGSPKLFIIDGIAAIPLVFVLFHPRLWTLVLAVSVAIILGVLDYYGIKASSILRRIRSFVAGSDRVVRPWWRKNI